MLPVRFDGDRKRALRRSRGTGKIGKALCLGCDSLVDMASKAAAIIRNILMQTRLVRVTS